MQPADAALPESRPVCPEHPDLPSVATCERCGRFLCETCAVTRSPPRCGDCHQRLGNGFGVLTEPFSIGQSLSGGWRLFRHALPTILPLALLFGIPGGLFTHFLESNTEDAVRIWRWTSIYESLMGNLGIGTWLALLVGIAEGQRPRAAEAFRQGASAWPRVFGASFRTNLQVVLLMLLLVIPGLVRSVTLFLSVESAFREPGRNGLETSARLVDGRRWEIFGLLLVAYLPPVIVTVALAFIAGFFSEFVPASGMAVAIVVDAAGRVLEALTCAVSLCAYYGLKHAHGEQLPPR
ncbi:B-box zinc finger protein [Pyxidicoccus sp. 3LG]